MNKQKVAKYFGWKLVRFIVLMIAVAIFSFVLLDLSPIDPVNAYLHGAAVSEAQRQMVQMFHCLKRFSIGLWIWSKEI